MIIDARRLPDTTRFETDVCVVGAGPAGIALALELARDPSIHVTVVESGGAEYTKEMRELGKVAQRHLRGEQQLTAGSNTGNHYYPLRFTRVRAFGGTSRVWESHGHRARPLDSVDYETRDVAPEYGWPFGADELAPYYGRAHELAGLGRFTYEARDWATANRPVLPLPAEMAQTTVFQFGPLGLFADRLGHFGTAENVTLVLHANVTRIAAAGDIVEAVEFKTLDGGQGEVRGGTTVLAAGALENARLMLLSRLGGPMVGHHFMEHLDYGTVAFIKASNGVLLDKLGLYQRHHTDDVPIHAMVRIADDLIRSEGLLNAGFKLRVAPAVSVDPAHRSARVLRRAGHRGVRPPHIAQHARNSATAVTPRKHDAGGDRVVIVDLVAEQSPYKESRVLLSDRLDRLDMPRTVLDWQIHRRDLASIGRSIEILGDAVADAGLGHLESFWDDPLTNSAVFGDWHHLGTTRMHEDPALGVTDADGKVHGTANLYCAGGSVFPTGGISNPTLTILALALRLADHLR